MTREEAILCIKGIKNLGHDMFTEQKDFQECLDMAIKALEKEPCEDWYDVPSDEMTLEQARQAVKDLRKKLMEYLEQEPTTKNDLGVREFVEIVVEYPPEDLCTYPEYRGKPYFSIKYKEGNDYIIGYGTYNPKVISRYLRDYFMPSVTPQEPKTGHWIATGDYFTGAYSSIDYVECSCCGYESLEEGHYCPFCGARMEN
jgi:hypothetical protein